MKFATEYGDLALTFDDVLLAPGYSEILPAEVDLRTRVADDIYLNIPIISAAMDTVTEAPMAIALARLGGVGVIHRNLTAEEQAEEVDKVKRLESGMIGDPLTLRANAALADVEAFPLATRDAQGRLLCAAAIGVGEKGLARLELLVKAGVDIAAIDTAHGHTRLVIETVREAKKRYPNLPILAGNVASGESARALIVAGAGGIKVGIGAGSICTTRIIAGTGVPQMSAIAASAKVCHEMDVPCIADGGIKYSGDIIKALAAGADVAMLGSMLAGLEESPGEIILYEGRQYKAYRGMGSQAAMQGHGADRYGSGVLPAGSQARDKLVAEGVEGQVPYKGTLNDVVYQLMGGVRSGMGYVGAADLPELRERARFVRITNAGLIESHPHDILITKEAPNYQARH